MCNPVEAHATYVLNEQQNCSLATHVAKIRKGNAGRSTRRSLSTAEYKVPCTLYSVVDKDLRVETSCITFTNYCYMCCSGTILLLDICVFENAYCVYVSVLFL